MQTIDLAQRRGQEMVFYQVSAAVRLTLELTGLDRCLCLVTAAPAIAPIDRRDGFVNRVF